MAADALATAVSVLGPEKGLELIAHTPGAEVLIVQLVDGAVQLQQSPGFARIPAEPRVPN